MNLRLSALALAMLGLASAPFSSALAQTLLDAQIVTAKGYAADAQDTPQAVEVLQPAAASAAIVGDLMRSKPGLAVQSDGAWGQNPVLRGLKKESVVVMVDGLRLNSAQPQGAIASFMGLGLLERRRLTRAHDAVDIEQRFFAVRVLVGRERVADVRADVDVVDGEGREHVDPVLVEHLEHGLGDFLVLPGFGQEA